MTCINTSPLRRYYTGRVAPAFFAHLFKAVAKQHHRELIPLFRGLLGEDAVVFDVGAHAGQFTKLFARLAAKGFVFAVEPQSYARRILAAAIRCNRLDNVAILPMALGERPGVGLLSVPIKASGSYGFGLATLGTIARHRECEREAVAIATLDQCVATLGLHRLDLVKADIEGGELAMLKGAQRTLETLRPALYLELDERHLSRSGGTLAEAWGFLVRYGYRACDPAPGCNRAPISEPRGGDILWLPMEAADCA
ncbi:MAG TPA: FkbM family methyltransferase [Stellaceae bacterium]|nr:FkbM family methyltransferase [Stellaceae bacterium]